MNRYLKLAAILAVLPGACDRSGPAGDEAQAVNANQAADAGATAAMAEASDEPQAETVSSWLIETAEAMSTAEVQRISAEVLPSPTAERLLPDAQEFQDMYIVSTERAYGEREAFDIAYRLKDLPPVSDAAPNFAFHQPPLEPRAASIACRKDANTGVPREHGWSLERMRVREAWSLPPPAGGSRYGEGVLICHPDSGWAAHRELDDDAIDKTGGYDVIDGGSGEDPLNYRGSPGHGTATGSVIVSRGDVDGDGNTVPPDGVTGVAPSARIVPIRTLKSVALFLDSDVARAVEYAGRQSCDVISMSLGGVLFRGLKKIVRKVVEEGDKIVVAAAGNCVGNVVAPATYTTTIAAAASNADGKPWEGSSRGRAVTMTAPGEGVYVARRERNSADTTKVEQGNGTSYATAAIAGAAADWIAFHGRTSLDAVKGSHSLSELFRFALQNAVTKPAGWDTSKYGPGILDVEKLLNAKIDAFPKDRPRALAAVDSPLTTLSLTIDRSPSQTRDLLGFLFGGGDPEALADMYGVELERIAATRPADIERILEQLEQRAPRSALDDDVESRFSSRMRAAAGE